MLSIYYCLRLKLSREKGAAGKSKCLESLFIQMHCSGFTFQQPMLEKCEINNEPTLQPGERGWNRMFSLLTARHMLYCKLLLYTYTNTAVSMVRSIFPESQNSALAVTSLLPSSCKSASGVPVVHDGNIIC